MIAISKATLSDLDSLVPLFDAYRQFYQQVSNPDGARAFLAARLEREESVVFLAFDEGRAVGFTQLYPQFSSVGMDRNWLLNDLYVDESARKRGVASGLLEAARAWGGETGARWLVLETAVDNYAAQALYEKAGWQRVEEVFYRVSTK
jgi:GNAT superfamily N-acetyltransferase